MKILFIDHDDSFSNNIVSIFLAKQCDVDFISYTNLSSMNLLSSIHNYHMVIFSPGPGSPQEYPQSIEFYQKLPKDIFVLGVCLGHQLMLHACGGKIQQIAQNPVHGRQIKVNTQIISPLLGKMRFAGTMVLYHSLGCFQDDLVFKTWHTHIVQNKVCLMAEHQCKPHIGVQFHPESFASTIGVNFLNRIIRLLKR